MNQSTEINSFRDAGLYPHQAEFIASFLKPGADPYQRLLSPPGTGVSATVSELLSAMIRRGDTSHILIITDSVELLHQYIHQLRNDIHTVPTLRIDKKQLRELTDRSPESQSPFYEPIIAAINIQLIYRDETGIASALLNTPWDLVVFDASVRYGTKIEQFLKSLMASKKAKRLLQISHKSEFRPFSEALADLSTVEWTLDLVDWDGKPIFIGLAPMKHLITFDRSLEETEFLKQLQSFPLGISNDERARFKKGIWLRQASSSLFAIEQSLSRERNRLAHGLYYKESLEDQEEADQLELDDAEGRFEVPEHKTADYSNTLTNSDVDMTSVAKLYFRLEGIPEDVKYQALSEEIARLIVHQPDSRICILTLYKSTANYLSTSLQEDIRSVFQITGSMPRDKILDSIHRFSDRGQVLVATSVAAKGMDLRNASINTLVHYDLPLNPTSMTRRRALLLLSKSASEFAMKDLSGVLPFEKERLRQHGFE